MRPFQIILMVVFVIFAILGLVLFANYSGFSSGSSKVGTVVVWGTLPASGVQAELNAIQTSGNHSFSKVSYVQQDAANFDNNLANAIASGNGPDLIIINQEQILTELSKINLIQFSKQVPERTFLDTYLPEDNLYLTNSGTYGIPYVLDPLVLYYNKDILTTSGVPSPPSTWEGITGLAPTLTKISAAQSIAQSTIAFGTYSNVTNARGILSLLFMQAGDPISQASNIGTRSALSAQTGRSANGTTPAVSVVDFYTQFSDPARTVYTWNNSMYSDRQQFLSGNLAFYIGYASELPQLRAANPNLNFDMTAIPQPQTASQRVDYGLAYAFAIPKASHNASGALQTALALAAAKSVPVAAETFGMVPSQRALLDTAPSDPYSPVYYPMALISQGWLSPAPADTDTIFSAMITNITSGRLAPDAAVSNADQALNAALGG